MGSGGNELFAGQPQFLNFEKPLVELFAQFSLEK
jgi:hypothetical protein